jgi:hypothetical protein
MPIEKKSVAPSIITQSVQYVEDRSIYSSESAFQLCYLSLCENQPRKDWVSVCFSVHLRTQNIFDLFVVSLETIHYLHN